MLNTFSWSFSFALSLFIHFLVHYPGSSRSDLWTFKFLWCKIKYYSTISRLCSFGSILENILWFFHWLEVLFSSTIQLHIRKLKIKARNIQFLLAILYFFIRCELSIKRRSTHIFLSISCVDFLRSSFLTTLIFKRKVVIRWTCIEIRNFIHLFLCLFYRVFWKICMCFGYRFWSINEFFKRNQRFVWTLPILLQFSVLINFHLNGWFNILLRGTKINRNIMKIFTINWLQKLF